MTIPIAAASPWPACAAYFSAAIFIGASGTINITYGFAKGDSLPSSLTWAAVAGAVAVVFALSWPALIKSLDARRWSAAVLTLAALVLTGAYSVTAALGSAAGGRTNAATVENATMDARKRSQAAYDDAKAELARLQTARPVAELEALLSAAKPVCRIVVANGYRDTHCNPSPALTAELGRAKRRAELEGKIERSAADLTRTTPAKTANSDAKAVASYLSAVGYDVDADRISRLLVLLSVLIVECGAGLSLTVGLSLSTSPAGASAAAASGASTEARTERTPLADARTDAQDSSVSSVQTFDERSGRSVRTSALEEWLRRQGGSARIGMRALAIQLRCSPSAAHEQVRRGASAGILLAAPGPRGTALKLMARVN